MGKANQYSRSWSEEEDAIIKIGYERQSKAWLLERLPGRTIKVIRYRGNFLRLERDKNAEPLEDDMPRFKYQLRKLRQQTESSKVCAMCGSTVHKLHYNRQLQESLCEVCCKQYKDRNRTGRKQRQYIRKVKDLARQVTEELGAKYFPDAAQYVEASSDVKLISAWAKMKFMAMNREED